MLDSLEGLAARRANAIPRGIASTHNSLAIVRAQGATVWDSSGRDYFDFAAGIAVCNVGHCHPRVVEAATRRHLGLPLAAHPETTGILNRSLFALLPAGAALVNVGRGAHLVDADLLSVLNSGKLSGATLDVFRDEPLPAGHPFWCHPRSL